MPATSFSYLNAETGAFEDRVPNDGRRRWKLSKRRCELLQRRLVQAGREEEARHGGGGKNLHPSKQLLERVAELRGVDPLDLYVRHVKTLMDNKYSHRVFGEMLDVDPTLAARYYRLDSPELPPLHFNVYEVGDCMKFERHCMGNLRLVIVLTTGQRKPGSHMSYYKMYDRRVALYLEGGEVPLIKSRFVVCQLSLWPSRKLSIPEQGTDSWECLWRGNSDRFLTKLDGRRFPSLAAGFQHFTGAPLAERGGIATLTDMIADAKWIKTKMTAPFMLVSHRSSTRLRPRTGPDPSKPEANTFNYLGLFSSDPEPSPDEIRCLIVGADDFSRSNRVTVTEASPKMSVWIKSQYFRQNERMSKRDRVFGSVLTAEAREANQMKLETMKGKREMLEKALAGSSEKAGCQCSLCVESGLLYGKSVSSTGPQKRMSSELDTFEYLKVFGLDTPENENLVREALAMSAASFDIESTTEWLNDGGGGLAAPFEPLSSLRRPSQRTAVQKACLLGYGDGFTAAGDDEEGQKDFCYREFRLGKNDVNATKMMIEFYTFLLERRRVLAARKRAKLEPILSRLAELRKLHFEFFAVKAEERLSNLTALGCVFDAEKPEKRKRKLWGEQKNSDRPELDAESSFENSLIGRFQEHLESKIRELIVFSFNGSNYDHVLLATSISCAFKIMFPDKKRGMEVVRDGSQIRRIMFKADGIYFHDVRHMLGPSCSLSSFAKMANLTEKKLVFPFSLFESQSFLDLKALPADPQVWFDSLRQETPSQETVDSVLRDFNVLGCQNVGEYLSHYLRSEYISYQQLNVCSIPGSGRLALKKLVQSTRSRAGRFQC